MDQDTKVIDRGALYYPNVHIRDAEWLKATLLCFPSLDRMVPSDYMVGDAAIPKFFAEHKGRLGQPMLGIRKIDDEKTAPERQVLLDRVTEDVEKADLRARFSEKSTRRELGEQADDFQIHEYKVKGKFIDYLVANQLAWKPARPLTERSKWFAVHPTIGQTILSTNAVALARKHDLEIVTESGPVHASLLGADAGDVYDALIREDRGGGRSDSEKVNDLFRFVVITEFDLKDLSLEEIVRLNLARGDLAALKSQLLKQVDDLGAMPTQEMWNDALRARSKDVLQEWAERDSFMGTLRRLGAPEMNGDLKEFVASAAGGVASGSLVTATVGALPGLVVGAIFAGVSLWRRWRSDRRPYQFLSKLEGSTGARRRHVLDFSPV